MEFQIANNPDWQIVYSCGVIGSTAFTMPVCSETVSSLFPRKLSPRSLNTVASSNMRSSAQSSMVTDHGKAGDAVGLPVIVQNICKAPVHLVGLTGPRRVAAPTIFLRCDLLALGRDQVLVGGDILLYDCCPAVKPGLAQTIQYDRRVLDTLPEQAVNDAGVAAKLCGDMFSAF